MKTSSLILLLLAIATTVFNVVSDNALLLGISKDVLMIIALVLSTAKLIYDQYVKFTEEDMKNFAFYYKAGTVEKLTPAETSKKLTKALKEFQHLEK